MSEQRALKCYVWGDVGYGIADLDDRPYVVLAHSEDEARVLMMAYYQENPEKDAWGKPRSMAYRTEGKPTVFEAPAVVIGDWTSDRG